MPVETRKPHGMKPNFVPGLLKRYANRRRRSRPPAIPRIGIAYGSDVKQITAILVTLALAHPEVGNQPKPPMVLFEDFGDSALIFTLRYRLKMVPGRDERRVASELRYAILEALTEAKVSIPFAEPNVRLTTDAPIEIRLQRGRA